MATIISGKELSASMKAEMAAAVKEFPAKYGRAPHLVVVLVGDDPASVSYVTGKAKASAEVGIRNTTIRRPAETGEAELLALIGELNVDDGVDGILVQLPLPKHIGLDVQVFMVKVSYEQKPYRRLMMNTWGAECLASPSTITASGRAALERDPNCSGSLGLAISEAVEMALQHPEDTRYCLGSVLNHVILHQTVIGQEAVMQMEMAGAEPDVVIGCFGGGSNFAGIGFPFLRKNLTEGKNIRIVAVEPSSCQIGRASCRERV